MCPPGSPPPSARRSPQSPHRSAYDAARSALALLHRRSLLTPHEGLAEPFRAFPSYLRIECDSWQQGPNAQPSRSSPVRVWELPRGGLT
jgi:hypothetical protein